MSGIRVLHVISEMATGGAEALVVEMARRSSDVGWHSAVASHGGRRVNDLNEAGVAHFQIALPRRTVRGAVAARIGIARASKAFGPNIVIAHNISATLVSRLARPRLPILTIFHGVSEPEYRNAAVVMNYASDRVVAVSDAIGSRLREAGLRRTDLTTIRNTVTPNELGCRSEARAKLGIPVDVPVALCLARMERRKRHDLLLDAWHKVAGDGILLLAGDGSHRPILERQAEPLGDRVRFLGDRPDVPMLLAAADITVLLSDWEGLPMAILESLAAGRPVVATDVGGVRELLGPGGGRCVPAGDVASTVAAINEMLYDETSRRVAAEIGIATITRFYDPGQMMDQYSKLVGAMLAKESQ